MPYNADAAKELLRLRGLSTQYSNLLRQLGFDPLRVSMDITILKAVVRRYMMDAARLHSFNDMPLIDCHKVAGYTAYWLCRLRPVTVRDKSLYRSAAPQIKHPYYVNELFAVCAGLGRINQERRRCGYKDATINAAFLDALTYSLKYRLLTGDTLSMMFYTIDNSSPKI